MQSRHDPIKNKKELRLGFARIRKSRAGHQMFVDIVSVFKALHPQKSDGARKIVSQKQKPHDSVWTSPVPAPPAPPSAIVKLLVNRIAVLSVP